MKNLKKLSLVLAVIILSVNYSIANSKSFNNEDISPNVERLQQLNKTSSNSISKKANYYQVIELNFDNYIYGQYKFNAVPKNSSKSGVKIYQGQSFGVDPFWMGIEDKVRELHYYANNDEHNMFTTTYYDINGETLVEFDTDYYYINDGKKHKGIYNFREIKEGCSIEFDNTIISSPQSRNVDSKGKRNSNFPKMIINLC